MTLCTAWIRETSDNEELFFATDSALTGGEKWDHCVKLFELPRRDCLICFAGNVGHAYPLLLNLISLFKNDSRLCNTEIDIGSLVHEIAELFTDLVLSISDYQLLSETEVRGDAQFLFGGWNWRKEEFNVWDLCYATKEGKFLPTERTTSSRSKFCTFIGEPDDVVNKADKFYKELLLERNKIDGKLEMEPLEILINIINDENIREVGGSPQIARVKKNGHNEILGIQWRNSPFVLGKKYPSYSKPPINYIDSESINFIEESVPDELENELLDLLNKEELKFIENYYREGKLVDIIPYKMKVQIKSILMEKIYGQYWSEKRELSTQQCGQCNREYVDSIEKELEK
jgi:hypothetical protein